MKKKTWLWLFVIFIVIIAFLYLSFTRSNACETDPVTKLSLISDNQVIYHIHPTLKISILGENIVIPSGIGQSYGIMNPIHMHDASGKIHVESQCARDFTLGDFFDVWGKTFNETCVLDVCEDGTHNLTLFVNGQESTEYRDLVLKDGQVIEIVYK